MASISVQDLKENSVLRERNGCEVCFNFKICTWPQGSKKQALDWGTQSFRAKCVEKPWAFSVLAMALLSDAECGLRCLLSLYALEVRQRSHMEVAWTGEMHYTGVKHWAFLQDSHTLYSFTEGFLTLTW